LRESSANDPAGYPVIITKPGAYQVTENLKVNSLGVSGIDIRSDDVTLDLGGYTLRGNVTCTGNPINCSALGDGRDGFGVEVESEGLIFENLPTNAVVRNGVIRGFDSGGVRLVSPGAVVEGLRVEQNSLVGIQVSGFGTVRHNVVTQNDGIGIDAGFAGVSVIENTIQLNIGDGLHLGPGGSALRNSIVANRGVGVGPPATNASGGGATLLGNTISSNVGLGLTVGSSNLLVGYADNAFTLNNGGNANAQVSGGIELGNNLCGASSSCTGRAAGPDASMFWRVLPLLVVGLVALTVMGLRRRA
jgi:hypothetical protein